jgi:hypothetical protein
MVRYAPKPKEEEMQSIEALETLAIEIDAELNVKTVHDGEILVAMKLSPDDDHGVRYLGCAVEGLGLLNTAASTIGRMVDGLNSPLEECEQLTDGAVLAGVCSQCGAKVMWESIDERPNEVVCPACTSDLIRAHQLEYTTELEEIVGAAEEAAERMDDGSAFMLLPALSGFWDLLARIDNGPESC